VTGSRSIVLFAGGLMFVYAFLSPLPRYKRVWAAGAVLFGLSLLADVAPQVAAPAAVLIVVALAAKERGSLGQLLGNVGKPLSSTPTGVKGPVGAKPGTGVNPPGGPPGVTGPVK
jgi:hypothetical protein